MDFTSQDIVVIEQALRIAMRSQQEESKADPFHEVLIKLQARADMVLNAYTPQSVSLQDGFRLDYDDSSDLL